MSAKRAERLQVMLTIDEVRHVEQWRFDNRMPSRSAAVRGLMNLGLRADAAVDESALLEGTVHSRDVGVVEGGPVSSTTGPNAGQAVLVLEGEPLAGEGIGRLLEAAGFRALGPAADAREAAALAGSEAPVAAVLDADADARTLAAVADRLAEHRMPFVIVGTGAALPERHATAPVVAREDARRDLAPALATLLG